MWVMPCLDRNIIKKYDELFQHQSSYKLHSGRSALFSFVVETITAQGESGEDTRCPLMDEERKMIDEF